MNPLQAIDALSAALGRRIRKASNPAIFELFAALAERLDAVSIDDRAHALVADDPGSQYRVDGEGRIVALAVVGDSPTALSAVAESLPVLVDLEVLALPDIALDAPSARAIAALPRLRVLLVRMGGRATLADLAACPALEALHVLGGEGLDLAPLQRLARLRAAAIVEDDRPQQLDTLAACPRLRSLGLTAGAVSGMARLAPLERLESLYVTRSAEIDPALWRTLPGLRSLVLESVTLEPALLRDLPGLEAISMVGFQLTLDQLPDLPRLEVLELTASAADDLRPLQRFTRLRHLALPKAGIADLAALQRLDALEFLDISGNPVHGGPPALRRLRHLKWEAAPTAPLGDAELLLGCENLEVLTLDGHALYGLGPLRALGRLRVLDLNDNGLEDIAPLAALPGLTQLDVSHNQIHCLAPLAGNLALTVLSAAHNPVEDHAALGALHRLERLDIASTGATDLDFAKRLRNLVRLDASGNGIESLEPLLELPHLAQLDVSANRITRLSAELVDELATLESLTLENNRIEGLDAEIYAGSDGRRTLQSLRDYYRGLARGSVRHDQVKLLLVGNGRVGKTSLVNRLIDDRFDPDQPSTHGIQLREWRLEHVAEAKLQGRPLRVAVWDFGGQDIYHATHRLFMRTRALFLLVWDQRTEHETHSLDEFGERYENFGLAYWLDYVKALSGSPVLVVQNKVDAPSDKQLAHGVDLLPLYPPPGGILDFAHVSAQRDNDPGMAALAASIRAALAQIESIGYELPASWVEVRDRLARMERRYIDWDEYLALCEPHGLVDSQPLSLALFLHQAGALFYEPGQFGDRLILDQRWAIDAVYALLDRRGAAYRDLRLAGRNGLSLELLRERVWRHFAPDEHQLLLDFMLRCELCFELGRGRYYVPQLLWPDQPSRVALRWADPPAQAMQIRYRFLHRAIVDRFLVRAGRLGADDEPEIWRDGIVVLDRDGRTEALVEADAPAGTVLARARGPRAEALLQAVRAEFDALRQGVEASVWVSADAGANWVELATLERHAAAGLPSVLSEQQQPVEVAALAAHLARPPAGPAGLRPGHFSVGGRGVPAPHGAARRPQIFVSYAWGDASEAGESREGIVDRLHDELAALGYDLQRDKKDLGYKGLIGEFMQRLGRGRIVVAVISDKYLKSPYCMYELLEVWRCGGFQERLFPIMLPDARIHRLSDQLDYVAFWQREKEDIARKVEAIGWERLSTDGFFRQYERYYKNVFDHLDRLLALLADWNTLSPALLEDNSFERLRDAIEARLRAADAGPSASGSASPAPPERP